MAKLVPVFSVMLYEQLDLNLELVKMRSFSKKEIMLFLSAAQVTYHKFNVLLVKCVCVVLCMCKPF